ncbi:hypothetical protein ABRY23_14320 [Melioribacteraceae bacterium 4301-Me]|uniref:hypothetical protein n=1 Tax=Pyranulibacter aquaticus TaxID=3163344 RepID=UPI00359B378A
MEQRLIKLNYEHEQSEKYLKSKSEIDGKYIWDLGLISKETFYSRKPKLVNRMNIFILYDSIGCLRCYEFHRSNLLSKIGPENIIVIYNRELKFIKRDFRKARIINLEKREVKYNQLILLVNSSGRIVYSDFPQYQLIKNRSEEFYRIVSRYFEK